MQHVEWETAIYERRSFRSYEQRELQPDLIEKLEQFAGNIEAPFTHGVEIRFFKMEQRQRLYNTLTAPPPNGAAFMCSTDVLSVSKAGFVGELFILYATSLGVATCWFGHYSAAVLNRVMPHLTDEEVTRLPKWGCGSSEASGVRAICITPLGYWRRQGARLLDRFTQVAMSSKRRPIRELLHPYVDERLIKPEVLYALDLARMAPSAANSQPWRFAVRSGGEQVQIYAPQGYKHLKWEHPDVDIGISASHFWLGLKMQQVQCQVIPEVRDGQAVWTFELK